MRPVARTGGLGVLVAAALLGLTWAGLVDGLRRADRDRLVIGGPVADDVVVVAVDAATLAASERPDRGLALDDRAQADLAEALVASRPRVVVWGLPVPGSVQGDLDRLSGALVRRGGAVLAMGGTPVRQHEDGLPSIDTSLYRRVDLPPAAVRTPAGTLVLSDDDGRVRRLALVARDVDGVVPALAPSVAVAAAIATGVADPMLTPVRDGFLLGDLPVRADSEGGVRLRFPPALTEEDGGRVISGAAVLSGDADLEGRLVLVGYTHQDLASGYATPAGELPPVLLDAVHLNTVLTASAQTPTSGSSTAAVAIGAALVATVGGSTRKLRWLCASSAVAGLGVWTVLHTQVDEDLLPDRVVIAIAALGAAAAVAVDIVRDRLAQRRRLSDLFGSYVPRDAVAQLLRGHRTDEVAGERLEVGIVFVDLRGFTPLAASREPPELRVLLERFYDYVCETVFAHGGTVIQFTGDEVFAVFGAPLPMDAPGPTTVACAADMLERRSELDAALQADGMPTLRFGIGVHVGWVTAAHVQGAGRRQYTVLGDPVNVASRLCGLAGADQAVVSAESIVERPPGAIPMDPVEPRGTGRTMQVFRLEGSEPRSR